MEHNDTVEPDRDMPLAEAKELANRITMPASNMRSFLVIGCYGTFSMQDEWQVASFCEQKPAKDLASALLTLSREVMLPAAEYLKANAAISNDEELCKVAVARLCREVCPELLLLDPQFPDIYYSSSLHLSYYVREVVCHGAPYNTTSDSAA